MSGSEACVRRNSARTRGHTWPRRQQDSHQRKLKTNNPVFYLAFLPVSMMIGTLEVSLIARQTHAQKVLGHKMQGITRSNACSQTLQLHSDRHNALNNVISRSRYAETASGMTLIFDVEFSSRPKAIVSPFLLSLHVCAYVYYDYSLIICIHSIAILTNNLQEKNTNCTAG